ncbi:MAG: PilN domain-containing protein [Phycisphaerae bacterium]|nr:PilN domain-containing protein [Phycisphaerae bacterium]
MSTINLLPEDYIQRRLQHRANITCLILFVIVMVGVIGAVLVSEQSSKNTKDVLDRINANYAEAAKLLRQMQSLEAKKRKLVRKAEITSELMERVPRSTILAIITNALPNGTSLVRMKLDTKRIVQPSNHAPGGSKEKKTKFAAMAAQRKSKTGSLKVVMEIVGRAGTDIEVARVIANLARNPLIDSVDLVYSEQKMINKVPIREFQLKLELIPDADAIDLHPNGRRAGALARPKAGETL